MTEVSSGFLRPTTTPTPDELFDVWLSVLSGSELKVLLYIIRRTLGFKKSSDAISLSQICNGITTRDGRVLDRGTGLARSTASAAVTKLKDYGLIFIEHVQDEERGFGTNIYRLRFQDESPGSLDMKEDKPDLHDDDPGDENSTPDTSDKNCSAHNEQKSSAAPGDTKVDRKTDGAGSENKPGVVRKSNQGSSEKRPALVRKSNSQQTGLQVTDEQQTGYEKAPPPETERDSDSHEFSKLHTGAGGGLSDSDDPVSTQAIAKLVAYGVFRSQARKLVMALNLSPEKVGRACAALDAEINAGTKIKNRPAVLVSRLEAGWIPPDPEKSGYSAGSKHELSSNWEWEPVPRPERFPLPEVVDAQVHFHDAYKWFEGVKRDLELQLPRETYDMCIRQAELADYQPPGEGSPPVIIIRLHDLHAKEWVKHRLDKIVERGIKRTLGVETERRYISPDAESYDEAQINAAK